MGGSFAMKTAPISRRRFLGKTAALGAAFTLLPGGLRAATIANGKLNIATIGVGGMGTSDRRQLLSSGKVNIVALCDIDANNLRAAAADLPDAATFSDYREMFARIGDKIDAVHIATPDHNHAPPAMIAINMGKHVYCQKPLTHQVNESRQLALAARRQGVVTQMGIQIHSYSGYRNAVALIRQGAIGKVKEVHSWSNKEWGYEGGLPVDTQEPPDHINWDAWLGPAPYRPYAPQHYHPAHWRRWYDFGAGTMGDMGIHILDAVASALQLTAPTTILSESPEPFEHSFGIRNRVHYTFPATPHAIDNIKITWYDGRDMPDASDWPMPEGREMPGQGSMFIGEKGAMLLPHVGGPLLLPLRDFQDYERPRSGDVNHYHSWIDACLGEGATSADFAYSGPLTETLLLGVLACRFPGQVLQWDAQQMRFTNFSQANSLLKRAYREGWQVDGLR